MNTSTSTATAPVSANRKDAYKLLPGDAPKPNTVIFAIYSAAVDLSRGGNEPTRNDVIEKVLAEYEPPRSRSYNREYLVGYISFGIGKGYLIEKEPAPVTEAEPEPEKAPAKKAPAKKARKAPAKRAAGEPRRRRSANA